MKKVVLSILIAAVGILSVHAKNCKAVFIMIDEQSLYSRFFVNCDTDGNGIVTYAEAFKATRLVLDNGGNHTPINDFDFLKFFPNLTELTIGSTTAQSLDLRCCPKLKYIDLTRGDSLRDVILDKDCFPQIIFPSGKSEVAIQREDEHLTLDGFAYCERLEGEAYPCYLVSLDGKKFGLYENGVMVVPCKYKKNEVMDKWPMSNKSTKRKKRFLFF